MLFSAIAVTVLGLASAAPFARQNAASGVHIVAGDSSDPTRTKCLAVRGGANVTLADGVPVEM